jgi:hypothetical protein
VIVQYKPESANLFRARLYGRPRSTERRRCDPEVIRIDKAQVRRPVTSRAMMVFMISLVPP